MVYLLDANSVGKNLKKRPVHVQVRMPKEVLCECICSCDGCINVQELCDDKEMEIVESLDKAKSRKTSTKDDLDAKRVALMKAKGDKEVCVQTIVSGAW